MNPTIAAGSRIAGLAILLGLNLPATAQSSLSIYGLLDVGVDYTHKSEAVSVLGQPVPSVSTVRVSPSLTSQSVLGFKGEEQLGGGYKASFTLESQMNLDNGLIMMDGRFFGRQAWAGLTTPVGEFRLGRQYAPMFYAYTLNTIDNLGATDVMAAGLVVNTLQVRQDNQLSWRMRLGGFSGVLSYSPNAGVASRISGARAVGGAFQPTEASGQILGGATAGNESADGRGRSWGLFTNYAAGGLNVSFAYHYNDFGALIGIAPSPTQFLPVFNLDRYQSAVLGAKYTFASTGTQLAGFLHTGRFEETGTIDPRADSYSIGLRQPVGAFSFSGEYVLSRFTNYTKGKDTGVMLGADYNLSKRTALYTRLGYVDDERGNVVTSTLGRPLSGGPQALLIPVGSAETPLFAGAGANNIGAQTSIFAVGVRHSF